MKFQGQQGKRRGAFQDTQSALSVQQQYGSLVIKGSGKLIKKMQSFGEQGQKVPSSKLAASSGAYSYIQQEPDQSSQNIMQQFQDNQLTTQEIKRRLDFVPKLKALQFYLTAIFSGLVAMIVYNFSRQQHIVVRFLLTSLAFVAPFRLVRRFLLQKQVLALQVDFHQLAGQSSRFINIDGITYHYRQALGKIKGAFRNSSGSGSSGSSSSGSSNSSSSGDKYKDALRINCFHGFGASSCSYHYVMQALADNIQGTVTASDTLGFGLTERVQDIEKYNFDLDAKAGYSIASQDPSKAVRNYNQLKLSQQDYMESNKRKLNNGQNFVAKTDEGEVVYPWIQQPVDESFKKNIIMMGHSMGANPAIKSAINHSSKVKALILIAPAVYQLGKKEFVQTRLVKIPQTNAKQQFTRLVSEHEADPNYNPQKDLEDKQLRNKSLKQKIMSLPLISFIKRQVMKLQLIFKWFFRVLYVEALRSFVSSKKNWERVLKVAYYDQTKIQDDMVYAYMMPKIVKNWEIGLFNFSFSKIYKQVKKDTKRKHKGQGEEALNGDPKNKEEYSPITWLQECVNKHDLKILIIHGKQDKIVPYWISEKLAKSIEGVELVAIDGCGHTPQEEHPELFIDIVNEYVSRINESTNKQV